LHQYTIKCIEFGTVSCGARPLPTTNSNITHCQCLLQHISASVIQGRRRDLEPHEEKVKYKLQRAQVIRESHLKNSINNTEIVRVNNFFLGREFVPGYTNSSVPFNSTYWYAGLAALGQLLNKQPNTTINKYKDTAQLIDKKKLQKEGTKVTKLITDIVTELKTTTHMICSWVKYSIQYVQEFWFTY